MNPAARYFPTLALLIGSLCLSQTIHNNPSVTSFPDMFTLLLAVALMWVALFTTSRPDSSVWPALLAQLVATAVVLLAALSLADTAVSVKSSSCESTRLSALRSVDRVETIGNTGCLFYTGYTEGFAYDKTGRLKDQGVFVFTDPDYSGVQRFRLDPTR